MDMRPCHDRDVTTDLLALARAGDAEAFRQLVEPFRHELHAHCYRILGSTHDAEDVLQETLLAAWQGLNRFEERASLRTWLYRIATNRCLNGLRSASHRPTLEARPMMPDLPEPAGVNEVVWLEPYPDARLDEYPAPEPGPEARFEASEAISLAFITALQLLPPRQRAVLVLRDVLGFHANEVAQMLETSTESVTSALKRARATLDRRRRSPAGQELPPAPNSPAEQEIVQRFTQAYVTGDVDGLVTLLTRDVWVSMPPLPLEYQGPHVVASALSALFGRGLQFRFVATRANGQPALGMYVRDPHVDVYHATGLIVLTLAGHKICALTRFDTSVLSLFGLARTVAGS